MFGFFKKVSISEQKILSKVARELDEQITKLTSNYSSIISPEQFDAFMKYQKACYLVHSYGQSWDGSDNMPRVIYNKALKELSAASKIVDAAFEVIDNNSVQKEPKIKRTSSDQDNFFDDLDNEEQVEVDYSSIKNITKNEPDENINHQVNKDTSDQTQNGNHYHDGFQENVIKIIKNDFDYQINTLNQNLFDKVINENETLKKNKYDCALIFMLLEMNSLAKQSNENSKQIDHQTKNMLRIIEKCSDPRSRIISKINELRSKQNLSKV